MSISKSTCYIVLEISCILECGVVLCTVSLLRMSSPLHTSCYMCNYMIVAFLSVYIPTSHVLFSVHLCVTVRSVLLWKYVFYCECCVCNAFTEGNLNHFFFFCVLNYLYKFLLGLQCTMVKCYVLGCTTSNRDTAGVLFRFPKDAERYVRDLI
jgi:hypothetical protein